MAEGDALCETYLRRLKTALNEVQARDSEQIYIQVKDHLDEARAALPVQTETAVSDILHRLGSPEEIAQAAEGETEVRHLPLGRRRGRAVLATMLALVVLGLGVAALAGVFGEGHAPRTRDALPSRRVPNVLGLSQSQAAALLAAAGFDSKVASSGLSTAPPGIVVRQSPPAGSRAPRETRIALSTSEGANGVLQPASHNVELDPATGSVVVFVPNVVGLSQAQAVAALVSQGLAANVSNPDGLYVRTETPEAGSKVPTNSNVVIGMG
jgi:hypothetical protein